ncbi:hypothetical protein AGABI2DRAFT_119744 [Agaricus bisporus var. bisporus H97]|uniref:hypothetical protein n=1 Tax=Agaricus bisporus var. bisporus (strain H97 / ATCC MYA-4626 / FGSC 10389) TaxID=936046 RepID=UPI00029F62E8|nr:hypothetical protein AGABI2DRAFT_119744 [Agaricus bisporus var. bisporus H97]EKV46091.1 hypothetical protein AGABI2DRAFT_119744 [Agaricus bisporus var. bisporus H97]
MSTEIPAVPPRAPRYGPPQLPWGRSFDYTYSDDDGIKESFLVFSSKAYELDKQLGQLANGCLRLGRVAGLLLAIKRTREMLRRTREVFFHNATALVPELFELAREDCNSKSGASNSERFHISSQYFDQHLPPFEMLPTNLEELATSFYLLYVRIDEFREFTDEGKLLKSLLMTLDRDLKYRASCAGFYSGRLNTPLIQRYVHQFINELQVDFEKVTAAVDEFAAVGVSAISHEQARSSLNLTNILTVSTFFSGVTASTLQMSTSASDDKDDTILLANLLWFMSMIFSVGAALNSLLAMAWKATRSGSRGSKLPFWVTMWIDGSQLLFLGISILTFSAGLIVFAFASSQASYTPYLAVASTAVTFIGLVAILLWMLYEMVVSPVLRQQADIIKSSGDSVHSEFSNISLVHGGIASAITNALPFLRFQQDQPREDVEQVEDKDDESEESPTQKHNLQDQLKMKLQGGVKSVSIINSALGAFATAGRKKKRGRHERRRQLKPKLRIDNSSAAVPLTELTLSDKPVSYLELARYGIIRDVAYSDDGKWLAVTCTKEHAAQSWTATLTVLLDTWHEGRVIAECLKWSPSGKKLIVKFEHRFDVWDLDAKVLHIIERHHMVQDVAWFDEDTFLVAEHSCVFKMDLTRLVMAVYRFERNHIRSIGVEMKNNYLVLITRVAKSPEEFEPACGRSEKRIIIYDMGKQEEIYQVPVLEDISYIYPIPDELDILITHKDQATFQLWTLDAGVRGAQITAKLKKRIVTPHRDPGDYIGPTRIGGNYNQFVFNVTTSGDIDIWRRESGMPYLRFQSPKLQEEGEGVHCFSWRRSDDETATFATAGIQGHTLWVWRGEELLLPKTPASLESLNRFSPKFATNERNRARWQRATNMSVVASSGSLSPREIERIDESVTEVNPEEDLHARS